MDQQFAGSHQGRLHCVVGCGGDRDTGLRLPDEHVAAQINDFLALVRMPLFSFLSGMVYALRPARGDIGPFAAGKARRLLVPIATPQTKIHAVQLMAVEVRVDP